ncbi:hypothetical protein BX600DRAFT_494355 [Xylariales sp. PMI_506]|nr:hypothetical protein BX600DRAFT_494355 [Xylariales sp. PMI_506]
MALSLSFFFLSPLALTRHRLPENSHHCLLYHWSPLLVASGEAIPQVANLSFYPPYYSRPYNLGGQNFTHCCLRAVNDSLRIQDGNLVFSDTSYFLPDFTINQLFASVQDNDFPCGAVWDGDQDGSPIVQVPYSWCTSNCGGWEISHFNELDQWVGPLVQFILPSLAFCLNIPRSRKLAIPHGVFQAHPRHIIGFTTYWIRLLGAIVIMTVDTFLWLSICFAFAGPMLLSAVYEYVLDRKILEFLRPRKSNPNRPEIPVKLKAQLLLAVVVGNLRISTADVEARRLTLMARQSSFGLRKPESRVPGIPGPPVMNNSWHRVMTMLDDIDDPATRYQTGVVSIPTKLKAILNSQARYNFHPKYIHTESGTADRPSSFGSTVGAPILFFVGGFIYTVLDIGNTLGDDDQAHALAFGMWWMTIPYLAIISCAMLASNSPSALQGIVYDGGDEASVQKTPNNFSDLIRAKVKRSPYFHALKRFFKGYELVEHTYEGRFQTVTLWNRGLNKRRWVIEAMTEYEKDYAMSQGALIHPEELRKSLGMSLANYWNTLIGTIFLLITPSLMAFLTSYNTPQKSLSCRTLTYLVYAISQICEILFWVWEARLKVKHGANWTSMKTVAKAMNYWGQVFVGFFAVVAAVGGTFMQLLGLYRSCACKFCPSMPTNLLQVPARYWANLRAYNGPVVLSTNTAEDITAAEQWWTTTGIVAVVVLCIICALAWWHQRRLRRLFTIEADGLEEHFASVEMKRRTTASGTTVSVPGSPMSNTTS